MQKHFNFFFNKIIAHFDFQCTRQINSSLTSSYEQPGPEVIKLFSCSTQMSMEFFLLINVKMPTIVGILTFMSGKIAFSAYLSLKKAEFLDIFILMSL